MKFECYLGFNRRFGSEPSEPLESWFCFVDFVAGSRKWIGNFLSSSSPVQNFRTSFPRLLSSSFCDRAWIRCFLRWIRAWIVEGNGSMMKIRLNLWELHKKLHWFCWILVLEKRLGFECSWTFFWICEFDPTEWRESFCFCLWLGA